MPYKTTVEEFEDSNDVSILIARTTPLKQTITGEQVEARWQPSHYDLLETQPPTNPSPEGLWVVLRWNSVENGVRFKVRCKASGDLTISGQVTFSGGGSKSTKFVYCRTGDSSFGG